MEDTSTSSSEEKHAQSGGCYHMGLYVNYNLGSQRSQRALETVTTQYNKSLQKLSTGFRINNASDDAAGLQISERLRSQLRSNLRAQDNVQDGMNVLGIVDGSLGQITENLQRMRELAVQAANDTLATSQRDAIRSEMSQLGADISRIANSTQFNGISLLDGSQTTFSIQLGPNNSATADVLNLATASSVNPFASITASALNVGDANVSVASFTSAQAAITNIDAAIGTVNLRRSTVGALSNRLSGALNNLEITYENLGASEARIRNVDVARESTRLASSQILQQAGLSMLAQANSSTSYALNLLN
jgi:flagellin